MDNKEKTVHENESIYIPMGAVHPMENPLLVCDQNLRVRSLEEKLQTSERR
ncbi:hypothetical protein JQ596_30385 [Bradyrhizobium manausense]|nr:hypothetical protein [Bradyrhizobium manausense]